MKTPMITLSLMAIGLISAEAGNSPSLGKPSPPLLGDCIVQAGGGGGGGQGNGQRTRKRDGSGGNGGDCDECDRKGNGNGNGQRTRRRNGGQ